MELTEAEKKIVLEIRALREKRHASLTIEIKDGKIVKFWPTEKKDADEFN